MKAIRDLNKLPSTICRRTYGYGNNNIQRNIQRNLRNPCKEKESMPPRKVKYPPLNTRNKIIEEIIPRKNMVLSSSIFSIYVETKEQSKGLSKEHKKKRHFISRKKQERNLE
jgi:hypothetical protein